MKKSNIFIAVLTVMAAASAAMAQEAKIDFDGKDKTANETLRTVAFDQVAVKAPAAQTKCKGTDLCEDEVNGTCSPCFKAVEVIPAAGKPRERSLNEILTGLNAQQKLLVFESLTFNKEGKLSSLYTKDIKEVLGEKVYKEVMKKFGIDLDVKGGAVRAIKDQWCVSTGTCGDSAGYSCTDNC